MATAKQLAARKLFAQRARAGTLKKGVKSKRKTPAKNPVKRTGISKTAYVKRASQATGGAPTKRLVKRRKAVASGKAPQGYFPNPQKGPSRDHGGTAIIAGADGHWGKKGEIIGFYRHHAKTIKGAQQLADKFGVPFGVKRVKLSQELYSATAKKPYWVK